MPKTRPKESEFGIPPQVETDSGNVIEEIMEAKEAKKHVGANAPADDVTEGNAHTPSITVDPQAKLGRGPVTAVGVLAVVLGIWEKLLNVGKMVWMQVLHQFVQRATHELKTVDKLKFYIRFAFFSFIRRLNFG